MQLKYELRRLKEEDLQKERERQKRLEVKISYHNDNRLKEREKS
jgi:hypothetical protein